MIKKIRAIPVVNFVKNVALPLAPKTVDEAPLPNAAPASAPFPCCTRINTIRATARNTCIIKIIVCIVYLSQIARQISINFLALSEAPPTRAPSTFCARSISFEFCGETLPPYKIFISDFESFISLVISSLIKI